MYVHVAHECMYVCTVIPELPLLLLLLPEERTAGHLGFLGCVVVLVLVLLLGPVLSSVRFPFLRQRFRSWGKKICGKTGLPPTSTFAVAVAPLCWLVDATTTFAGRLASGVSFTRQGTVGVWAGAAFVMSARCYSVAAPAAWSWG